MVKPELRLKEIYGDFEFEKLLTTLLLPHTSIEDEGQPLMVLAQRKGTGYEIH